MKIPGLSSSSSSSLLSIRLVLPLAVKKNTNIHIDIYNKI